MFWKFYGPHRGGQKPETSRRATRSESDDSGSSSLVSAAVAYLRTAKQKVLRPIEVKLHGLAVGGVVVAVLGLMTLMYQIGQQTADVSDVDALAGKSPPASVLGDSELPGSMDHHRVVAMGSLPIEPADVPGGSVTLSNQRPAKVVLPSRDPRAVGLNYFTLLAVPPDMVEEVRELQAYLAENGLSTYLDKTNNGRLRNLVDVTRGYSRQELDTLEYAEHRYRIQALGQRYRRQNGGRGPDLSDIYPDRYDGSAVPN